MSEDSNPFVEPAAKNEEARGFSAAWIAAGIASVLLIVVAALWVSAQGKLRGMQALRSELQQTNSALSNALAQIQQDQSRIAALQTNIGALAAERDLAGQKAKDLEGEMRSGFESKDVTISNLQGKLTVTILDRVLFDSGEAVLQPGGEGVLRQIGAFLIAHPELKIHVIGHTDDVPIHTARFASNWELSAARALAAVHFLTEKAGVDPRRVGAVGYGEFRPIADNATAEGRAKNRRIAITILPDELAGADTVPTVKTNDSAGAPPLPTGPADAPPPAR